MSYNVLQGSYKTSSDTIDFESISIGRFKITQNGVYVGNKQVIDRFGNLLGLNAVSNQISNITTYGMFTGVRQGVPSATLDVAGTGNFMGNVACASTLSAAALVSSSNVAGVSGSFSGTVTALRLQAPTGSISSLTCSTMAASTGSISSLACSTISAGTYLGINPVFVGTGSTLLLQSPQGTLLTLLNPNGGGGNSFANIDFSGYSNPSYNNGAPFSLRFYDDGSYSAILSFRAKAPGGPNNGQNEVMRLTSGGQTFVGPSTDITQPSLNLLPSPSGRNGIGMGTTLSGNKTVPMWVLNNNTGGGNPGSSLTNFYIYNYGTGLFPLIISPDCQTFQVNCATLTCNTLVATNTSLATGTVSCARVLAQNIQANGSLTSVWTRSQYYAMQGNEAVYRLPDGTPFPQGAVIGQLGLGSGGVGVDVLGQNGNGTLRITASDGGEASLGFGGSLSSYAINTPAWVMGRGSWGVGTNFAINNGLNGNIPLLTLTTNNSIGVRIANPQYGFDCIGTFRFQSGGFFIWQGGYTQLYRPDSNAGDGLFDFYSDVGGNQTNIARLSCNGNWNTKTGSYNVLSDRRKKKNICDARRYLDSICKLRVRKYSWDDSDDGDKPSQLGWIADEVETVMPGLIDTIKVGTIDDFKCVKSSILIPMLVTCCQELQERLQAVERLLPQTSA